jgi:hypothetical protein
MATMEQINFQRDGDSARPVLDQHVINHGLSSVTYNFPIQDRSASASY